MMIDIHGHIGASASRRVSRDELQAYRRDAGVDRLMVSNFDAARDDTEETDANVATLRACESDPAMTPLYWARPGKLDHHPVAMAGALFTEAFAGVVLAPQLNQYPLRSDLLEAELRTLEQTALPALVIVGASAGAGPREFQAIASENPRAALILTRCGPDPNWLECVDAVRRAKERAKSAARICCSHASSEEVLYAVQALGADRVLFGSDATSGGAAHGDAIRALCEQLRATLPGKQFERVCGQNAFELFRRSA